MSQPPDGAAANPAPITSVAADVAISLEICFESDWHIGSGAGRHGSVDRSVQRDDDGLPFVPARSLKGIWRDACETIAVGLDNGTPGRWSAWVDWTFGTQPALDNNAMPSPPSAGAISVGAARLDPQVRDILADDRWRANATIIHPGVRINADTGTAEPDHLRFVEFARTGMRLGSAVLALCELPQAAVALLIAGAASIDHIGGKRRRGSGRCTVTAKLSESTAQVDSAIAWIEAHDDPGTPPSALAPKGRPTGQPAREHLASADNTTSGWRAIEITITAEAPVIVTDRTVGNLALTATRLPGSVLIAMAQRVVSQPMWPFLGNGSLRIGEGLPATAEGAALAPAPRSWARPKGDAAATDSIVDLLSHSGGPVARLPRDAWVRAMDEPAARIEIDSVPTTMRIHNVVDDALQRPTSDIGGVFGYQTIDSGARWVAEILVAPAATPIGDELLTRLAGTHRIGRARNSGYGTVRVEVADRGTIDLPTRRAAHGDARSEPTVDLLLLTDAILLDPALRPAPTPAAFLDELQRHGVVLPDATTHDLEAVAAVHRREGWHARWQRPRPSLVCLAAGTVVRIPADKVDLDRAAAVGRLGVGERVSEGFGRFQRLAGLAAGCSTSEPAEPPGSVRARNAGDRPDDAFVTATIVDALLQEVRVAAEAAVAGTTRNANELLALLPGLSPPPTRSQLGALRSRLLEPDWQAAVHAWVKGVRATTGRSSKWCNRTLEAIEQLAQDPKLVYERLPKSDGLDEWPEWARDAAAARAASSAFTGWFGGVGWG
jgi:CRISPR-associated protein Csx10